MREKAYTLDVIAILAIEESAKARVAFIFRVEDELPFSGSSGGGGDCVCAPVRF